MAFGNHTHHHLSGSCRMCRARSRVVLAQALGELCGAVGVCVYTVCYCSTWDHVEESPFATPDVLLDWTGRISYGIETRYGKCSRAYLKRVP